MDFSRGCCRYDLRLLPAGMVACTGWDEVDHLMSICITSQSLPSASSVVQTIPLITLSLKRALPNEVHLSLNFIMEKTIY